MEISFAVLFFILGSVIGSFLNVVSDRYGSGLLKKNRSFCMSCNKELKWYELIPIFSFLFLRGRCSDCKNKIALQNILTEFFTGLVFLLLFLKFNFSFYLLFLLIVSSILIVIFLYDLRHKIIPNGLVYTLIILSLISVFIDFSNLGFTLKNIETLFAGIIVPLPFFLLWWTSKGKWMGFGDVKLMAGIGLVLGISAGFSAVVIGFWIGALVSVGIMLYQKIISFYHKNRLSYVSKQLTMKSEIPLGPFLILGFILEILCNFNLI